MTTNLIIGLASDHAGYELKQCISEWLGSKDFFVIDYGTNTIKSVNYPIFGHRLAEAIEKKEVLFGIAMCGSGNGMNMTLNKHSKIRSALCWNEDVVRLSRMHNDANVLVLPARIISKQIAKKLVDIFLKTPFEGGRHQQRIDAIPYK